MERQTISLRGKTQLHCERRAPVQVVCVHGLHYPVCPAAPAASTTGRAKVASNKKPSQTKAQQEPTIPELLLRLEHQKEETSGAQKQAKEAEAACMHAETKHREQQQNYHAELDEGKRLMALSVIQSSRLASAVLNTPTGMFC